MDKNILSIEKTLFEYYYNLTNLAANEDVYYNGSSVTIHNYVTGEDEYIKYGLSMAYKYGINNKSGMLIIDLKVLAQKMLDLLDLAIGNT